MAILTTYTYTISTDTLNAKIASSKLANEIEASQDIVISLSSKRVYISAADTVSIEFLDVLPNTDKTDFLDPILAAHDGIKIVESEVVKLDAKHNNDGIVEFQPSKSYSNSSKSFTTPDYSSRQTWWYDTTAVTDEILTADGTFTNYTTTRTPSNGWDHDWIYWKKIPNNARQSRPELKPVIKVNDVVVTTGFSINNKTGVVTFSTALTVSDVVKASYHYANSSEFILTPTAGKKLLVDYVETQFSAGCGEIPAGCRMVFQAIYNGPAVPAMGIPANYDVPLKTYEYYTGSDFMNESTRAYVSEPFMELTKKQNILPWDYLTGHTLKPVGDPTTNILNNEFNKLKCIMVGDGIIPNCEIATGTFYCMVEDL